LPAEQAAAAHRLLEHQKKLPAFPKGLPPHVIVPNELVYLLDGKTIAGYRMKYLPDAEVLYRYGERSFRDQGASDADTLAVLADLHRTVAGVHQAGVVIGDFNDLNVLAKDRAAYLIDADSMQFGPFTTSVFTGKFVDPLICNPTAKTPMMIRPHTADTDWYAYAVMLMQVLLFVGPYGGVHMPTDPKQRVAPDARSLRRLTVFDPDVKYPKPARHYRILPDSLLDYFQQVFQKDVRGVPPLPLIEEIRFTTCTKCGTVHARSVCPSCTLATPTAVKEVRTGTLEATKVISIDGVILHVAMQGGRLRYLYHEAGEYRREGGRTIIAASPLDPNLRFRIRDGDTILARGTQAFVFSDNTTAPQPLSVEAFGLLPLVDTNSSRIFYAASGSLMRTTEHGYEYPEQVGKVLPNQTLFWVGETLGFGFYRAAELSNFFVFDPRYRGVNDSVNLPPIRGQLIDATAVFSDSRIWFFTSTKEGQRSYNRCHLLDATGAVLGSAEATPGDGSWLGSIRGATAAGNFLLSPTDDGVVRVELDSGTLIVRKEYPDTKRFVDSASKLFVSHDALFAAGRHDIWRLVLKSS
jgi:H/ACA ribonucleoprotein complex subunit 3